MHDLDLMLQYQFVGKNKEAREISDRMEELGPKRVTDSFGNNTSDIWLRHRYNRGWFLLQEGNYREGSQCLDAGRFLGVYGSSPLPTKSPIFNPKENDLKDKKIVINLEGGFGDEIIHVRFAKSYKNAGASQVIVVCSSGLKDVFSRIDGVDQVVSRKEFDDTVEHDYWIPGFSSGWVAGHTFENFPNQQYIYPLDEYVNKWKNKMPKNEKVKIGIRWAGNPKFEHQQFRKFPVDFITNLKKYNELELYSFQKDHNTINLPDSIVDLQHELETWDDTIGALKQLDLLITSCTSLAHLAGALGIKTWVVVPILPYHPWAWKSPESTKSPYYQTVKIFRQDEYRKWNTTWQKLYSELEEEYNLKNIELPNCDKEYKKINLGCGLERYEDCINVDKEEILQPDVVFDLNEKKWPWKDDEFSFISAKNILQYLNNPEDTIKEMYRISENGALWEIKVPDSAAYTSDSQIHFNRKFNLEFFENFDQRKLMDNKIVKGYIDNLFAYKEKIDLEIVDVSFEYHPEIIRKINSGVIQLEHVMEMQRTLRNINLYTTILIQVNKVPRYNDEEFENKLNNIIQKKGKIIQSGVGVNKILN